MSIEPTPRSFVPTPLTRRPDWRARLAALCRRQPPARLRLRRLRLRALRRRRGRGPDRRRPAPGACRRYTTEVGAARVLRRNGFADPAEVAAALLPAIPVAAARHGDVAAIRTEAGVALAVVGGPHLLAARAGSGLIALPLTAAFAAFRV